MLRRCSFATVTAEAKAKAKNSGGGWLEFVEGFGIFAEDHAGQFFGLRFGDLFVLHHACESKA